MEKELRDSSERSFHTYGESLENVTAFRYLGRVITAGDDDGPAVVGKLQKARKGWGLLLRILIRVDVVNLFSSKIRSRLSYTQL